MACIKVTQIQIQIVEMKLTLVFSNDDLLLTSYKRRRAKKKTRTTFTEKNYEYFPNIFNNLLCN